MDLSQSKRVLIGCLIVLVPILGLALRRQDQPGKNVQGNQPGDLRLEYTEKWGYLPSLLKYFKIPVSSQTLFFAKNSFQLSQIAPNAPRAVYFNDDVYIGWVNHGQYIEVATVDPKTGPLFYTLS